MKHQSLNDELESKEEPTEDKSIEDTLYVDEDKKELDSEDKDEEDSEDKSLDKVEDSDEADDSKENEDDKKEDEDSEKEDEEEKDDADFSLKLPEESALGDSFVEDVTTFAKENKLSNEIAQEILEKHNEAVESYKDAVTAKLDADKKAWRETVMEDKELGGSEENLKVTVNNAKKVVDKFASSEFIGILKTTGYGDHPEVLRFFSNIGKMMSSDSLVPDSEISVGNKPIEDYFYN